MRVLIVFFKGADTLSRKKLSRKTTNIVFFFVSVDYSEERVAVLLNADLADTLGNLLQRVTAEKLNPDCFREDEGEEPTTTAAHQEQLESEWNKISEDRKDRALIDRLKNLTGGHYSKFNNIGIIFLPRVTCTTCLIFFTEIVGENCDEYKFNTGIEEIMHCLYKVSDPPSQLQPSCSNY